MASDLSTATVTGVTGPAIAITGAVYTGIARADFNFQRDVVTLHFVDTTKGPLEVDIATAVTITLTVASGVYTLTIATS